MIELLTAYSIEQILILLFMTGLSIKGVVDLIDWIKNKIKAKFSKEERGDAALEQINLFQEQLATLAKKVDLLIDSDKDSIKAYITKEYHHFTEKQWIDDYSLDCLERRYEHYVAENGNSFIGGMMEDIRKLDRTPQKIN